MPAVLLEQLRAAGVNKTVIEDTLSDHDKTRLLEYLRRSHGAAESKTKITLTRKQTSEIKKADSTGKSRTIQVEVRKKRVFVKRESGDTTTLSAAEAQPASVDAHEVELREQEERRQDELAARQAAELAEKQEQERRLAEQREAETRAAEEQARAAAAAAQAPAATPVTTLHKPSVPGAGDKKAKKPVKQVTVWSDESAKKRTIKTRGGVPGASGWHSRGGGRHRAGSVAEAAPEHLATAEPMVREVHVPETITVAELAHKISLKATEVIKALMKLGQMVTINQVLDQ
jgi:translation initiation factor IF-2